MGNMKIDIKILEELKRYNSINNYLLEQDAPPADPAAPPADPAAAPPADPAAAAPPADPAAAAPPPAGAPPAPAGVTAPTTPVDTTKDPDVEKIDKKNENKKEVDVTDLVKSNKNFAEKQDDYFKALFDQLSGLENKLSEMDSIVNKLNSLEAKVEKYRTKSPEEKMELRTLDSGPFNQKLTDFFEDKQDDFEKSGKNQYVITPDEVENFQPTEIKKSFRNFGEEEDFKNI
jgi:hypothetical protein